MSEAPAAAPRLLPLHKLHRRWGGRFEVEDDVEVPAVYGTVEEEYEALRERCGLADRSDVARLELMGEDRQRFLNGLVTCDVKALAPGEGAYGFFTDRLGKILADVVVLALEDRLWLELPSGAGSSLRSHLEKYIIADRVEVKPLDDLAVWTLAGPRARDLLAGLTREELAGGRWSHRKVKVEGSEVQLVRQGRLGVEAFSLWTSASIARALAEGLLERGGERGLRAVGRHALEILRVAEGIGRFGRDFGPANFPQETGEEEAAVSYTKGCYLGQEIVARIHYRGGVNHALRRLVFDGPPPPRGAPLWFEGKEVGNVTSAVRVPRSGAALGLGMVHRRGWAAAELSLGPGAARARFRD
jgi:aminomethyltransferase